MMRRSTSITKGVMIVASLLWLGPFQAVLGQCPSLAKYEVDRDQINDRNTLRFFLEDTGASSNRVEVDTYEYNLWDKSIGGYLYNPSKLDAGFHEDKKIILIHREGVVEFRNVPEGESYFLVIYSPSCRKLLGPSNGITIQNSTR